MTINQTGQPLKPLTNTQLIQRLRDTGVVEHAYFIEEVFLGSLQMKREIKVLDCVFSQGFTIRDATIMSDASFEGCRMVGECRFDRLIIPRILNFTKLNASEATFIFDRFNVPPSDKADIWLGLEPGTICPKLDTNDETMQKLFRQLPNVPGFLSYRETRGDFA